MKLSVCIITKNEKEKLEHCLKCLLPYDMELVVVDTGSTDGTCEMVKQYMSNLYHFAWCDDFAAAKNYAVVQASHDLVMVIDSDEYLRPLSQEAFEEAIDQAAAHPGEIGRICRHNRYHMGEEYREDTEWINRMFDRRYYTYRGRIHEQLVKKDTKTDDSTGYDQTYRTVFHIDHDGYEGSRWERKKKAERNIRLLLQEYRENPADTYVLYQLGKGYYMAEDYENAVAYFEQALSYDVDPHLEYVIDLVETYGYALLNSGQPQTALLLESVYKEFSGSADFQFLMGLIYMNNERFADAIAEFEKAAAHTEAKAAGVNSYLAYYNAGVICECLGQTTRAKEYYKKCQTYEKAVKRLAALCEADQDHARPDKRTPDLRLEEDEGTGI